MVIPNGKRVPRTHLVEAKAIDGFVRGLSMRDVESLTVEATDGRVTRTVASQLCAELQERYAEFRNRDLADTELAGLFGDAIWLAVRPTGNRECVQSHGDWTSTATAICWPCSWATVNQPTRGKAWATT